ncbi:MAG TPA: alpha/beta fold hydrolase [Burkholderiaceae bacterium]|jgi:triacylglycerol esterase/lipase EstA (alpha/beta hydrolase family)
MISRVTKILLALQILAGIGLLFAIHAYGVTFLPALILSAIALLLFRLVITANNFFWAWIYRSETPAEYRISFSQGIKLFVNEFKATILTSSRSMPFWIFSKYTAKNASTLPVLLIHGYVCNSGQWQTLSQRLSIEGITHHAIDLEPVLGDIDSYVPIIHQAIDTLRNETGSDKIVIVAHSMGGLAARAYLKIHGSMHIAKVITLGTPHHGTALANFGKGKNSRQMRWSRNANKGASSAWLQQLAKDECQSDYGLIVSIYSHHDNIIAPQTSSHLLGARNIAFHGIGHVALLFDISIQDKVIEEIRKTSI